MNPSQEKLPHIVLRILYLIDFVVTIVIIYEFVGATSLRSISVYKLSNNAHLGSFVSDHIAELINDLMQRKLNAGRPVCPLGLV